MKRVNKRDISQPFFDDLYKGKLNPLLELVRSDDTLCLEFRGSKVVIYYRGGALYTINEKTEHNYDVFFNGDYRTDKDIDNESNNKESITIEEAKDNVGNYKFIMDKYFSKHKKYEREFQQLILRENNYSGAITDATDYYILDIEYVYKDDDINARYDMLAILWPSETSERKKKVNIPLSFIEVKYGDGAVKSDKGASGISKHIDDYVELRKKPEVIAEIAADMKMVFQKKHKLELITSYKGKDLDITIDNNNVEFLFIFANHDPDKSLIREELEQSIKNHQEKDSQYLDEIKVVKASEMGYGLFAYKDKKYCYPTIRQYIENK